MIRDQRRDGKEDMNWFLTSKATNKSQRMKNCTVEMKSFVRWAFTNGHTRRTWSTTMRMNIDCFHYLLTFCFGRTGSCSRGEGVARDSAVGCSRSRSRRRCSRRTGCRGCSGLCPSDCSGPGRRGRPAWISLVAATSVDPKVVPSCLGRARTAVEVGTVAARPGGIPAGGKVATSSALAAADSCGLGTPRGSATESSLSSRWPCLGDHLREKKINYLQIAFKNYNSY